MPASRLAGGSREFACTGFCRYARACHLASVHAGGLLEPLYRLHATRLKALRMPGAPLVDLARCECICCRKCCLPAQVLVLT